MENKKTTVIDDDSTELDSLHKILQIIINKNVKNLPPDFFIHLNQIIEDYISQGKIGFLMQLFKEMDDDEIIAFVFNRGERRNRPYTFIINDNEIDIYGGYFRKMIDHIISKKPEFETNISKQDLHYILKQLFIMQLNDFFDKDKLLKKFEENYKNILQGKVL